MPATADQTPTVATSVDSSEVHNDHSNANDAKESRYHPDALTATQLQPNHHELHQCR
jgi:hypothetical protein